MHKLLMVTMLALVSASLLSCAPSMSRERLERGGLSEQDFESLKALNTVQLESEQAMELAASFFPAAHLTPHAVSEKVTAMAKLMQEADCQSSGSRPQDKVDSDWHSNYEISSETCPVFLRRRYDYLAGRERNLRFFELFHQKPNEELSKLNPVVHREGGGHLEVKNAGGARIVRGGAKYDNFEVHGYGRMRIEIVTNQRYEGFKGGGGVAITIQSQQNGGWSYNGSIAWEVRTAAPVFRVNAIVVDRKVFLELFSAYGLVEIMDRSLNMR